MPTVAAVRQQARAREGYESFFWWAFRHSATPMWIRDVNRVLLDVNDAAIATFGYAREDIIGARSDQLVSSREWKRLDSDWQELLRTGSFTGERELLCSGGRRVRAQLASHTEVVTGRRLVLTVAIELRLLPVGRRKIGPGEDERPLTARELEILHYVAMGKRAHQIADELFIAPSTVETHLRNAMGKLGARSQAQLVAIAFAQGLLEPALMQPDAA
jgi:PAS domain S-box-containing protein